MGFNVKGGGKTAKRMKSFHRATLINAHFDTLNIHWANPTDYTSYDFNETQNWMPWVIDALPRLLDGGFVVSSRLIQEGIKNLPVYEPHNTLETNEYYYDPTIKAQLVHFLNNSRVYNGRILTPEGIIKGNFIVSDNLPDHIDVITSRENLKTEVTYDHGYRLLAEPQGPKSRVITDDQTVINFPKLFRKSDMEMWLKEEYEKMFQQATSGQLLTNWKSVFMRNFSRENQDIEDNRLYSLVKTKFPQAKEQTVSPSVEGFLNKFKAKASDIFSNFFNLLPEDENMVLKYNGGPGAPLGIGNTIIKRYTKTGLTNPLSVSDPNHFFGKNTRITNRTENSWKQDDKALYNYKVLLMQFTFCLTLFYFCLSRVYFF
jgi:hypothetical protein